LLSKDEIGGKGMPEKQSQVKPPFILSIPSTTLDQLRARRSQRKPAPAKSNRATPSKLQAFLESLAARLGLGWAWQAVRIERNPLIYRKLTSGSTDASSDRPILSFVDVIKCAGELDPQDAAKVFCEDMNRLQAEVEEKYDAFLLDPGMGPMTYITSDGRILSDSRTWDGEGIEFATSLVEVISALVVGAKKTGIVSLLDLIPALENGMQCSTCHGTGWFPFGDSEIVCPTCSGRGECSPG
jgi:hypothetical protein